jgi:hypothetical protein
MDQLTDRIANQPARPRGRTPVRLALVTATLLTVATASGVADAATPWTVSLAAASGGQSQAGTLTAPTGLTSSCSGNQNLNKTPVNLSWLAASHAANYTVSQATSANGTYTVIATGVAGTTYSTTPATAGTYYWKVAAANGNWSSPSSGPSPPRTVQLLGACS